MPSPPPVRDFALQAKLFRGFADASRLAILQAVRGGPVSVGAIVEATGLSQPNVSNHLRCLSECGLVVAEQRGRFVYYAPSDDRIERLLGLADELLAELGCRILACARYEAPGAAASGGAVAPTLEERR